MVEIPDMIIFIISLIAHQLYDAIIYDIIFKVYVIDRVDAIVGLYCKV